MSSRKPGFTLSEHRQAGTELKEIIRSLERLKSRFVAAYPVSGERSRTQALLTQAIKQLRRAQIAAEELLAAEHPQDWRTDIYT